MLFFVLQGAIAMLLARSAMAPAGQALVVASGVSGMLVYALMRLVYWLSKTSGVPAMLSGSFARTLGWGMGAGLTAAAAALGYLQLAHQYWPAAAAGVASNLERPLLLLLTLVAAPLCQEFIFRGLIFSGLRRSTGLLPSMLMSAALFAIVHPPASMLPAFLLGLLTAYVYDNTRALLAPVLVHAAFNVALLVAPLA